MELQFRNGKIMKTVGLAILVAVGTAYAWDHPNMFLNGKEIEAIKSKVKAGQEPWKSAHAKMLSVAGEGMGKTYSLPSCYGNRWLGGGSQRSVEDKCNYSYDHHRGVAEQFGRHFVNIALAWHMTGEKKYLDWCVKNIDSWFLNSKTAMQPAPSTGGSTQVGIAASFMGPVYGVDLAWPGLDAERQGKLREWFKTFNTKMRGTNSDGGIGSNNNRADWWAAMTMASAVLAQNAENIKVGVAHLTKRSVGTHIKSIIDPGKPWGEDDYSNYGYFTVNALTHAAEIARHHGMDMYGVGDVGGRSKLEAIWDWWGQYAFNPSKWKSETKNTPAKDEYFGPANIAVWEIAYAYKDKPAYLEVINKGKRPLSFNASRIRLHYAFGPITLTHARGTYPFTVQTASGSTTGISGSPAPMLSPVRKDAFLRLTLGRALPAKGAALYTLDGKFLQPAGQHKILPITVLAEGKSVPTH